MSANPLQPAEIEQLARGARDIPGLSFCMANDAWGLLGFRQAVVLHKHVGRWLVRSVSGLVDVGETTPYQNFLKRIGAVLEKKPLEIGAALDKNSLPEALASDWEQWWPGNVYVYPLTTLDAIPNGFALYVFDQPLDGARQAMLNRFAQVWLHAWALLSGKRKSSWRIGKATFAVLTLCALAAMFVPVRQSVLAPAEIISLQSTVIAAPVEGVVKEMLVRPNQSVKANQPLVALDDTTLRNRRDVLSKSLGSAQAELMATTQKSFDNQQSRGEMAPLAGRVDERKAELAFTEELLKRSMINSPKDGIAVFGDPNDWRGRPVAAGERLLLLADPKELGVVIHVAVPDAIAIEPGAEMRLFLHVAPLTPLDGKVIETGYQAMLSPDNIASYRIRAKLEVAPENKDINRIGFKGTAKLYGPKVSLGYLLFRRPMATVREWLGL
jgi:Barrel-sandwich domain of CusB or HlyD membrane-fusion